jgi:hypothetical protein
MDVQQRIHELTSRLRRLEDESAIGRLVLSYRPAADSGLTAPAASAWRVGAVRRNPARAGSSWKVQKRTNRVLDSCGGERRLFGEALQELFGIGAR